MPFLAHTMLPSDSCDRLAILNRRFPICTYHSGFAGLYLPSLCRISHILPKRLGPAHGITRDLECGRQRPPKYKHVNARWLRCDVTAQQTTRSVCLHGKRLGSFLEISLYHPKYSKNNCQIKKLAVAAIPTQQDNT
jgi:hypothetical protein